MKNYHKIIRNTLYIVFPLCLFAIAHLMVSFVQMDINPINWSKDTRAIAVFLYVILGLIGIGCATVFNRR